MCEGYNYSYFITFGDDLADLLPKTHGSLNV